MSNRKELLSPEEASSQLEQVDLEIIRRAKAATVHIACEASMVNGPFSMLSNCSGIHVGNGRIITARHAVDKYESPPLISVYDITRKSNTGQIIYKSDNLDIAVLQTDLSKIEKTEINTEKLATNQTLFITATPGLHLPYSFRVMYIGDMIDLYPNEKSLERSFIVNDSVDASSTYPTIRSGFSGGGVFNTEGKLVGMIFGRSRIEPKSIALKGHVIYSILQAL